MKANRFKYARPSSLDEAFELLDRHGEDARVLAGGQSLLIALGMRLAAPEVVIDIGDLAALAGIELRGEEIVVGALTRHVDVLESPLVRRHLPLLAEAITHVGHVGIRNRGTFAGSLAYADPAAELPACVVTHGATVVTGSSTGRREIAADAFFTGLMETALRPDEMILEVRIPVQRADQRHVFAELARRHGDFAMAGIAGLLSLEGARIREARLCYFGCSTRAAVAQAISAGVVGQSLPIAWTTELDDLLGRDLEPGDSPGLRADTKLALAAVITRRALDGLLQRAPR
jgi:carbon-monoxide dehydrogenase medium subunit